MSTEYFPPKTDPDRGGSTFSNPEPVLQPDVPVDLQPGAPSIDLDATYSAAEARLTVIAEEYEAADEVILRARDRKASLREEEKRLVRLLKSRTPRRRSAK